MAYQDLREFITALEARGWLKRIQVEVDPILEIAEITDRVSKRLGPALLFEHVKGSTMPVLINAFGAEERMNLALGVTSIDEIAETLSELLEMKPPERLWEKLKLLPKLKDLASAFPKKVKDGPCKEVIVKENPSLEVLPILKCWPKDAGRYITFPLVFTKDPETGIRNVGTYRMQVFDEKTTAMHWHPHKGGAAHYRKAKRLGKRLEVAVALGCDPATTFAATLPLPEGVDELLVAYSLPDLFPVFHLTCLTHRFNPIYQTIIVGRPPQRTGVEGCRARLLICGTSWSGWRRWSGG